MLSTIMLKQSDKDITWTQFDFDNNSGLFVLSLSEEFYHRRK